MAFRHGILLEEEFLPHFQLGPLPLPHPTFLQGVCKSYSIIRSEGGEIPPPPRHRLGMAGVWHSVLFRISQMLTYHRRAPLKKGVYRWCDLVVGGGAFRSTCQGQWPPHGFNYEAPAVEVPSLYGSLGTPPDVLYAVSRPGAVGTFVGHQKNAAVHAGLTPRG